MIYTRFPSFDTRDLRSELENVFFPHSGFGAAGKKNTNNNSCHRSRAPISDGPIIIIIRGKSSSPAFASYTSFCEYSKDDYYYYFSSVAGRETLLTAWTGPGESFGDLTAKKGAPRTRRERDREDEKERGEIGIVIFRSAKLNVTFSYIYNITYYYYIFPSSGQIKSGF